MTDTRLFLRSYRECEYQWRFRQTFLFLHFLRQMCASNTAEITCAFSSISFVQLTFFIVSFVQLTIIIYSYFCREVLLIHFVSPLVLLLLEGWGSHLSMAFPLSLSSQGCCGPPSRAPPLETLPARSRTPRKDRKPHKRAFWCYPWECWSQTKDPSQWLVLWLPGCRGGSVVH